MRCKRIKHVTTLEVRLAAEAIHLRAQAARMLQGFERNRMLRKARQDKTASHVSEWLRSPGLRRPG